MDWIYAYILFSLKKKKKQKKKSGMGKSVALVSVSVCLSVSVSKRERERVCSRVRASIRASVPPSIRSASYRIAHRKEDPHRTASRHISRSSVASSVPPVPSHIRYASNHGPSAQVPPVHPPAYARIHPRPPTHTLLINARQDIA